MYYAKDAAKAFVDQLNMSLVQVGVVSFSSESTLDIQLTNNSAEIKAAIDDLSASGYTNIGDGISTTNDEFLANGRDDSVWAYILLSDGKTNRPCPHFPPCDPYEGCPNAREYAVNQSDISIEMSIAAYTIGLGADTRSFDEDLLKQIATKGYYYAPSAEDLANIYAAIARDLVFEVEYDMVLLQLTIIRAG
jgi:Mg-chelatase subunit ChlD